MQNFSTKSTAKLKHQIIVLNTLKFRDNITIVNTYCNNLGKSSFIVYGGTSGKKRGNLSLFHPLSIVDIVTADNNKGDLPVIKEYYPTFNLNNIRTGIVKNSIAVFIGELVLKTLREPGADNNLFQFITETVLNLEKINTGVSDFHTCFIVNYCKHLGYMPNNNNIKSDSIFDIASASFSGTHDSSTIFFSKESSALLAQILIESDNHKVLAVNGNIRYNFINEMLRYLSYHQGIEIEIKSLKILHEVFE